MSRKTHLAVVAVCVVLFFVGGSHFQVIKGNPTGFGPPNPTKLVDDPPTIVITFPEDVTYNGSIVPLNITIIQPSSWYVEQYPRQLAPLNTVMSVSCVIDRQPFVIWNGTYHDQAVSHNLPGESQFTALIEVGSGMHIMEVNVDSQALYYPKAGFLPSSTIIHASQNVAFDVETNLIICEPTVSSIELSDYRPFVMTTPTPNPELTFSPSPIPSPTLSPSPSPSGSPTQQSTIEPSATPHKIQDTPTLIIVGEVVVIVAVAAVVVALVVYFAKGRGEN